MYDIRRRATLILAVAAVAAVGMAVVPSASAAPARSAGGAQRLATGNPWGQAREVPGTAALNKGHDAEIASVSCGSAGNCSAGGYYQDAYRVTQAFVVSEVKGTWRKAEEVPGIAAMSYEYAAAEVTSVSCASAGNCSAGGYYDAFENGGAGEAFVVNEVNGRWRKAEEVPGTAALNKGGDLITSVSCASAGNCSAGGSYQDESYASQAFVVSEVHGRWRKAEEVPGTAALNKGGDARLTSVSCASPGNCSAGGSYASGEDPNGSHLYQAFAVSEVNGRWRKAGEVPGTAALNIENAAGITSVSCGSAGNCSAGGYYNGLPGDTGGEAFVVSQVHGRWRKAEEVPGLAGSGETNSVSCPSAGNCSAGGTVGAEAFVVGEVHGTWRRAEEVPGIAALNPRHSAGVTSVSCASPGNCSAGGSYEDVHNRGQSFVVSEVHGRWRGAEEVPGTAALSKLGAQITSVACGSAGHCSAGGVYFYYKADISGTQAFVVSRK